MPDIERKTISATQVPAILNQSPYATRWMIYNYLTGRSDLDQTESERMEWGKRLQGPILEAVADKMKLDVHHNAGDRYDRCLTAPIGCTRDATIIDPQRGVGIVEVKNVDKFIYLDTWDAERAPAYVELQVQAQLLVPVDDKHGTTTLPEWGLIACLVGGNELVLYERQPIPAIQNRIIAEAHLMMQDIERGIEPPVTGLPIEIPELVALYPESVADKWLDVRGDAARDIEVGNLLRQYEWTRKQRLSMANAEEGYKAKMLALAQDAQFIRATGAQVKVSRSQVAESVATEVGQVIRKASTRVAFTPKMFPDEVPAKPADTGEYGQ